MIINPIIPVWLMSIICIIFSIVIIGNKQLKEKLIHQQNNKISKQPIFTKQYMANIGVKIAIVIFLFVINLRLMIPNGEELVINSDINILFVIDKSVSMSALDYQGSKERLEGVVEDCCYLVDELSSCRFSIITFGDTAQRIIPFTTDTDMVQAELRAIKLEDSEHAKGTSINLVKDILEKTLKDETKRQKESSKFVVFFISDGEITKQAETLESFSNIGQYILDGAVMGYGTTTGGKMVSSYYAEDPSSPYYYVYYYDDNYDKVTAISKIDEKNLKQLANDMKLEYIQMSKTSKINEKVKDIQKQIADSQTKEEKIMSYQDIYYYFAIPLVILLLVDFSIQKRKIG